jgi:HlyD family secretion protein
MRDQGEKRASLESTRTVMVSAMVSALAVALSLLASGCSSKDTGEPQPVVKVQAARAVRTTIQQTVSGEAVLYPINQASIVPKISAPIAKFYVNRGDRVRQDELLATLENRDLAAAVTENGGAYEQAQATYESTTGAMVPEELTKAQADVSSAKEQLDAAQQLYDSRVQLYKQGALARKDLDQAAVGLAQAKAQFDTARQHLEKLQSVGEKQAIKGAQGQLTAARGKYEGATAQLRYSEIRSPIGGVVTDRPLYEGEMATAGTPLMTIMDLSKVVARAHIPESQAVLLKVGDSAELRVEGEGAPIKAKVVLVSPALDPNSTTVEVWIEAPNRGGKLPPGTSVNFTAVAKTVKDAVVIPASAVLSEPGQLTAVMVVGADGHAHQHEVATGIHEGDRVEIVKGLEAGEQVVTSGAYGLPDNTKVTIEASSSDSAGGSQSQN